jgi:phage N-6-adenine-methyltransferase
VSFGLKFLSKSHVWKTPKYLFDIINKEFNIELDPCTTENNLHCKYYFTEKEDGLNQDWKGLTAYINPPYGKELVKWVKKSYEESLKGSTVIMLLQTTRTNTKWFHKYINNKAEIRFLDHRIKFDGANDFIPTPYMFVIWKGKEEDKI